jgi:hypothetical protein
MLCVVFPSRLSRPALKRRIRIEPLFRNAEALLPPAKAGGSHQSQDSLHANSDDPPLPGPKNSSKRGPLNRRSLGYPRFPVQSCGFGRLHVVLFREKPLKWSPVRAVKQAIRVRSG